MTTTSKERIESTRMTGAQVLIRALEAEGVEVIFGYPGAATIPIHDTLLQSRIRHVLTRHEQGAAHAADGYARATGRVGVCIATSGPGALNLVTGIATAHIDSVPIVAITGQVATYKLGTDAFQEADTTGVTMPIVKHSYLIESPYDVARAVREAFAIASSGRPGVVVVDMPVDVAQAELDNERAAEAYVAPHRATLPVDTDSIQRAAALIEASEDPIICAGGGVIASGAADGLAGLAERIYAPVVYTLMGKGAFPDSHPLNLGMLGMHGTVAANRAVRDSDLILAIGMRFSDRATGKQSAFARNARIVHFDIDAAEIGKMRRADASVVGDAAESMALLLELLPKSHRPHLLDRIAELKQARGAVASGANGIAPREIIAEVNRITAGQAVIVTDVGQHQMWSALLCQVDRPRNWLSSGGLGTMGFGLPAAIGAQVARPGDHVFLMAGDGSILMNSQELMTAVEQRTPLKICLFNNGYLGMVRQWQELFYDRRYASTDISAQPDFVKLIEAYGGVGLRVRESNEIVAALEAAMRINDRPTLIDFRIDREANVFPMIPAGGSVDDMIVSQPGD